MIQIAPGGDHSVVGQQAGAPVLQGGQRMIGQRLRAEQGVGRAADRGPPAAAIM